MILVRTPFRLPLGGGGTDLPSYYKNYEGSLLTAAINKYMYININKPAIVDKIKVSYNKVEIVEPGNVDSIQHDIVRETLKYFKINYPLEIFSLADLSAGTGMGSSSSYTVGLLKGLNQFTKRYISTQELAEEACKVEIELLGKPIGKQDQYAAAFGGIIQLEIDKPGKVNVIPLKLDQEVIYELENRLLMFYTNIERDANVILGEQSKKMEDGSKKMEDGRWKTENGGSKALEAMHAIKEIGKEIKTTLINGNICEFGRLLHQHWETKKSVTTKMSNTNIDDWYELALKNGAIGGKIMGAGGGGFLLLCAENGKRKQLRTAMEGAGLRYMDFRFDWEGSKVLVNF